MELSREDVLHIAKLAKMSLEDEEIDQMRDKLSDILKNFEILQTIDTESVEPTSQPNELFNATKPDIVVPSLSHEDIMANAPHRDGDFFKIHAVMDED